jgi:hypothetical protein
VIKVDEREAARLLRSRGHFRLGVKHAGVVVWGRGRDEFGEKAVG